MKKTLLIISAFIIAISSSFAQYDQEAKAILDKVSTKYKGLKAYSATFVNTIYSPVADINESTKGKAIISGNKFNISLDGQEIISDGKNLWTYLSDVNEVNLSTYEPEEAEINPANIYTLYQSGYKYVMGEAETIDGTKCQVVELNPEDKNNQFFKVKIWVNSSDYTIKRWRIFEKSGNRYTYDIVKFQANPSITDNTFKFNKQSHPGVEVVDLR